MTIEMTRKEKTSLKQDSANNDTQLKLKANIPTIHESADSERRFSNLM